MMKSVKRWHLTMIAAGMATLLASGCGTEHLFDRGETNPIAPGDGGDVAASFDTDVKPALASCISCHGGGAGGWTYDGGGNAYSQALSRVDLSDPEASLLLQKGAGALSHAGGTHFAAGGATYDRILEWIEDGAEDN